MTAHLDPGRRQDDGEGAEHPVGEAEHRREEEGRQVPAGPAGDSQ